MNLLLDTHVFLWWNDGDPIQLLATEAIRNPENEVWLSAASAWGITNKASLGKLRLPDRAARFVETRRQLNLDSSVWSSAGWLKASIGKPLRPIFATAPQLQLGVRQRSEKPFGNGHLAFFGLFNRGI